MKMFAEMKTCIIKELIVKLDEENLMNDHLTEFFLNEIKQNKMIKLTANKNERKTKNEVMMQKENKEKRAPTEHQSRVSVCMVHLKEKFPEVKHTIRMGTANYMATYLKENDCLVADIHNPIFEKALILATSKMNRKENKEFFAVHSSSSNNQSKDSEEEEEKKNITKIEKEEEESDDEVEEEEEEEEDMTDLTEASDDDDE